MNADNYTKCYKEVSNWILKYNSVLKENLVHSLPRWSRSRRSKQHTNLLGQSIHSWILCDKPQTGIQKNSEVTSDSEVADPALGFLDHREKSSATSIGHGYPIKSGSDGNKEVSKCHFG
jgi:hypothetical protein